MFVSVVQIFLWLTLSSLYIPSLFYITLNSFYLFTWERVSLYRPRCTQNFGPVPISSSQC